MHNNDTNKESATVLLAVQLDSEASDKCRIKADMSKKINRVEPPKMAQPSLQFFLQVDIEWGGKARIREHPRASMRRGM
jgi:hypothetical protein